MKNEKDKKLDDLFKKRLENPEHEAGYREEDWDALENMLDERKRRPWIVYLYPLLGTVAAATGLLFLGLHILQPKINPVNHQQKTQIVKSIPSKTNNLPTENKESQLPEPVIQPQVTNTAKTGSNNSVANNFTTNKPGTAPVDSSFNRAAILASSAQNANKTKDSVFDKTYAKNHPVYSGQALTQPNNNVNGPVKSDQLAVVNHFNKPVDTKLNNPILLNNDNNKNAITLATAPQPLLNSPTITNTNTVQKTVAANTKTPDRPLTAAEKSNEAMMKLLERTSPPPNYKLGNKTQAAFKPHFTGGIIGAQDINGAGSFSNAKLGSKAGLVFSAGVSQKFTVSTGAVYSNTPYAASYDNFSLPYQPKVSPTSMSANCQMLDIPINIGYKVYTKGKNTVSVGTGLSSYIMLQQDYNFAYAGATGTTTRDYSVPNTASYLFKILNLNATYERQISSRAGITVQPYLKLPLADVGYSQVKLQTTGVAVGLSWNLDSSQP